MLLFLIIDEQSNYYYYYLSCYYCYWYNYYLYNLIFYYYYYCYYYCYYYYYYYYYYLVFFFPPYPLRLCSSFKKMANELFPIYIILYDNGYWPFCTSSCALTLIVLQPNTYEPLHVDGHRLCGSCARAS